MIIGCVQPKRFPAKAARTFMALLLATLKNEHANRAGVRRHDQISLLAQRAGQARPDAGVGREPHEEIAEEQTSTLWIAIHAVSSETSTGKVPGKNTCREDLFKGLNCF